MSLAAQKFLEVSFLHGFLVLLQCGDGYRMELAKATCFVLFLIVCMIDLVICEPITIISAIVSMGAIGLFGLRQGKTVRFILCS